ncbi:HK97 family phage prohead protease [Miniphocaeibacter massiliensis]|uniref:HK97 family phage prohead protease n=1 Tax=Miniphocaeibacter massiliensis TaxID=2041841 RepID=UPI001F5CEC3E|nr:HK97 family phage prohead protease [Miniphocaeibacter massiliensis]
MNDRVMNFMSEFRSVENEDEKIIEGYFIRYNEETELYSGVYEEITREAVEKNLKGKDVRCLFNHDTAIVLGRTGNNTLELKSDEKGLYGKVRINLNDNEARDIYYRIERGDINACSFGFYILDEGIENRSDGTTKITIRDIDLFEVSPVTFPAYPTTNIAARQKQLKELEETQNKIWRETMKGRLKNGTTSTNVK